MGLHEKQRDYYLLCLLYYYFDIIVYSHPKIHLFGVSVAFSHILWPSSADIRCTVYLLSHDRNSVLILGHVKKNYVILMEP